MKPAVSAAPEGPAPLPPAHPFPIVGIGASAGGLEALEELLRAMPRDTGMGFVVVTHQHPGHTSLLPELLSKTTDLPVLGAANGMKVEPNRVYVCPPGGQLDIAGGILHRLDADRPEPPHLPIDHFFRSLALDQEEKAICIILSGTGTDGTLGLKAIKGASGMALVQQVQSAKYGGMPSSAVATGLVDYVLPPSAMPAQLVAYARGPYLAAPPAPDAPEMPAEPMQKIFLLLRSRTGHNFSGYKPTTIRRRIERRMNLHQIETANQYVRLLQENPHEIDVLFKELLISVTSFFRDPEAFDVLASTALPALLTSRPDHDTLRGWVPGCATGEEAYSLAILLRECIDAVERPLDVQLFGTDLDNGAIDAARSGRYPDGIAVDVAPQRLARFFTREDNGYRIRKDIREMVVFAVQDAIKDPPFTKLDLVACRNLLIYLNADLQQRLLALFHYALKPGGLLLLGPSETIGGLGDLYETVDKKWKIFRRKASPLAVGAVLDFPPEPLGASAGARPPATPRPLRETDMAAVVDRLLLARYAPASVLVNERGDVVFIHGRTGAYLEPAAGQPRLNVHDMAREGLKLELASALRHAAQQGVEARHEGVRVRTNGDFAHIDFSVLRIQEPEALRGLFLIAFHPHPAPADDGKSRRSGAQGRKSDQVASLERELQCTKESLQITIEELETSNEELKSANEELQSTNEELQSTNEELETSKEEMQSLNEELSTVNAELHAKVDELSRANDDMQNLLNSTEIATIFLDRELNIQRYTEQARHLVNLIPSDIGRPLADLVSNLDYDRLVPDAREVLRTLVFKQAEVQTKDGAWFLMRIMPYRTADNVIDGLVLTFVDINPVKSAEQDLALAKERLAADLEAMTALHEIGLLYLRGVSVPAILGEVLAAAVGMTQADRGDIALFDPVSTRLTPVARQGFDACGGDAWSTAEVGTDAFAAALLAKEPVVVADLGSSPLLARSAVLAGQWQAGIRAVHSTPVTGRTGKLLGRISTLFKEPHRPDERALRVLDLLARKTAEMLEQVEPGPDPSPEPGRPESMR